MPDFVPPQRCKSTSRSPSADGWLHEIKFDGYRIQMRVEDGDVSLKTRTGLDWTDKFPAIATAAAKLSDAIIDGEIVALSKTGDPDFSELQTALSDGRTDEIVFFAFDLLFSDGDDLRQPPLFENAQLNQLIDNGKVRKPRMAAAFTAAAALAGAYVTRRFSANDGLLPSPR